MYEKYRARRAAAAVLVLAGFSLAAGAGVRLQLRIVDEGGCEGSLIDVAIVALADGETAHAVSAIDVILSWRSTELTLQEVVLDGPYGWLYAGLPPHDLDGLNTDLSDGDALFTSFAQLGQPAFATPIGLRVATLRFVRTIDGGRARLRIVDTLGGFATTAVFDGFVPNLNVLTEVDDVVVGGEACDLNCDGSVNQFDIVPFIEAVQSHLSCSICAGDSNGDGTVNAFDIESFVACLTQ